MRRFIFLVMLVLLPIQFVWGAAAGYCQHESGAQKQHFGHHAHQHQAKVKAAGDATPDPKSPLAGDDPDCSACHFSCVHPVSPAVAVLAVEQADAPPPAFVPIPSPHRPSGIDRPRWRLAA